MLHPDRNVDLPRPRRPYWFLAVLAIAGAVLLVLFLRPQRGSRGVGANHPGVGQQMPKIALEPLLNAEQWVTRDDLRGKATLINFWGPWCGYCIKEFPELLPLEKKYRGSGNAQILLISYPAPGAEQSAEELRAESKDVLSRFETDPPVYRDPESQLVFQLMKTVGFNGFPTSILLDGDGKIRGVWTGYDPGFVREMDEEITRLAAQQKS